MLRMRTHKTRSCKVLNTFQKKNQSHKDWCFHWPDIDFMVHAHQPGVIRNKCRVYLFINANQCTANSLFDLGHDCMVLYLTSQEVQYILPREHTVIPTSDLARTLIENTLPNVLDIKICHNSPPHYILLFTRTRLDRGAPCKQSQFDQVKDGNKG